MLRAAGAFHSYGTEGPSRGYTAWTSLFISGHSRHHTESASPALILHDASLRKRVVASRDGCAAPRRRETYSLQYVDGLSGGPTRLHAAGRLAVTANPRLQQKLSNTAG